jgi:hypothetical protein
MELVTVETRVTYPSSKKFLFAAGISRKRIMLLLKEIYDEEIMFTINSLSRK